MLFFPLFPDLDPLCKYQGLVYWPFSHQGAVCACNDTNKSYCFFFSLCKNQLKTVACLHSQQSPFYSVFGLHQILWETWYLLQRLSCSS